MGTEKRTNDMNMDMTSRMPRAKKMRRRILALTCALAIALLQCAVIVTVGTEEVNAADGKVTLELKYQEGMTVTREIDAKSVDKNLSSKEITIGEGDEATVIKLKGPGFNKLFTKAGASSLSDVPDNVFIVTEVERVSGPEIDINQFLYKKCKKDETSISNVTEDVDTIGGKTTAKAVEFSSKSVSPSNPAVGKTATITYSLKIDSFLKGSKEYSGMKDDITKIKWTPKNATVTSTNPTKGESNVKVKVKVSKKGNVTVTPSSANTGGYSMRFDTSPVNITGKDNNLANATITGLETKTANGKEQTQSKLKVVLDGVTLKEGRDYSVSYKNNVKPGTATVTVTGKGGYKNSKSAKFTIQKETTKPTKSKNNGNNYRPGTATRSGNSYNRPTTRTGTTSVPTVTYTPDRTITVKEVYLGQQIQEEEQQNPYEEMYEDPYATDESDTTNDWEDMDTSVDFGPAASSAAAAAAVCGAGAIGRIRRFRVDTKTIVSAASQAGNQTTAQAGAETGKKSRLSRFKKS